MEDLSKDKGKCFSRKLVFVLTLFGSIFPAVFICLNRRHWEKQYQRVGLNLLPEAFAQIADERRATKRARVKLTMRLTKPMARTLQMPSMNVPKPTLPLTAA